MDIIMYHNNCPDGWAAAFISKSRYPEAELMGLNHGLLPEAVEELFIYSTGKDVIMVDYSLRTRELNDRLNAVAKSFRILDHHKTALAVLDGAPYATFDMKRSGAGMAWDYLFGKDAKQTLTKIDDNTFSYTIFTPRPWWVDYTEDQDLWNWALPDSPEINAFLMVQPRTVEAWEFIARNYSAKDARDEGKGVRQYVEYYTRSVTEFAQEGILFGKRAAVLNIPYVGVSEAGNALCKAGFPLAVLWFERNDGQTQFSLRGDGSVDVSGIAKFYGGGGHNNAAGFQVTIAEGRALVDQILDREL